MRDRTTTTSEPAWAYGVTAVPERRFTTLPKTLQSLERAGFDKPQVFFDGDSPVDFEDNYVVRHQRIGAFGNWALAAQELFIRNHKADRFALFQDDVILCANLRQYLEACPYPKAGYLNLFTFGANEEMIRDKPRGWCHSDQKGRGALGLVFDSRSLQTLLGSSIFVGHPLHRSHGDCRVDGTVSDALRVAGYTEWIHGPSLAQHIGDVSTVGNVGKRLARTFPGEGFDCIESNARI